jgi:putative thioredoxin
MSTNATPYVIEVTEATFDKEVVARSSAVPVVVDFWAPWCQPCRILGPRLEKLAEEYGGRFVLAKADTEQVPKVAAEFGIRSIPAVFGMRDGQIVDSFVGALPEPAIRQWIERLLPSPAESLAAEAKQLATTDPQAGEAKYREALALAPNDPAIQTGLARLLLDRGQTEESRAIVEGLERRGFLEPAAERLKAEIGLRMQADEGGGVERCRAEAAAHPGDLGRQLKLAEALAAAGQFPEALERCLALVEADRKGVGEEARQTMLRVFQLLPADSDLTDEYRRKLSLALF